MGRVKRLLKLENSISADCRGIAYPAQEDRPEQTRVAPQSPAMATALTPVFGPQVFMYMAIIIAVLYGGFVTLRLFRRDPIPLEDTEPYQQVSAQNALQRAACTDLTV